uniref:Uncharacterized protein n=1 Tax=Anguilla anguilla TaxID=7936 RepID=A0A0E9TNY9_ANGAN
MHMCVRGTVLFVQFIVPFLNLI